MVRRSDVFTTARGLKLNRIALQVTIWLDNPRETWRIWKLLPVKVEGVFTPSQLESETIGSGSPPSIDRDATGQSSTHTQHAESERDDFGTTVTEVTTVTTRRKYRVEDA
jgi:hypothetical protein